MGGFSQGGKSTKGGKRKKKKMAKKEVDVDEDE